MPGEWSKEVGEYGEKVIGRLLELIGWLPFKHPVTITCHRDDLHKIKTKQHGLDYLKYYKCPLHSDTQKTISISAKYYETYPTDPSNMLKSFLSDLGKTMHCLKFDKELGKFKASKDIRNIHVRGLLFYLNHTESEKSGILDKISKFRNTEPVAYEPIFVVDNKIATFLYSAIKDFKNLNPDSECLFSYPRTEQNLSSYDKLTDGPLLPLEFLTSNILPIKMEKENHKHLFLYVNEEFSKNAFSSLIGFCHDYTNGWASKMKILFPNYRELHNKKTALPTIGWQSALDLIHQDEKESHF